MTIYSLRLVDVFRDGLGSGVWSGGAQDIHDALASDFALSPVWFGPFWLTRGALGPVAHRAVYFGGVSVNRISY